MSANKITKVRARENIAGSYDVFVVASVGGAELERAVGTIVHGEQGWTAHVRTSDAASIVFAEPETVHDSLEDALAGFKAAFRPPRTRRRRG